MAFASRVFQVGYTTIYVLLYLILLALLISVPADVIRQSVVQNQTFNILVIAVCCVATVLIVAFIYATRLYINRSVLASIPKAWIPIEKGDMKKYVRKMIVAGMSRSAAIAYAARPRVAPVFPTPVVDEEGEQVRPGLSEKEKKHIGPFRLKKTVTAEDEMGISLPPVKAVWGEIAHPGWASPTSPDLPDLQYGSVIKELPNLIEAKAVTLAPPDRNFQTDPPMLDSEAVSLLQRTEEMGLRDYLTHLVGLRILEASPITTEFIARYEFARFSTRPLSNRHFRELMHLFAEILRSMQPLETNVLSTLGDSQSDQPESDIDNDAPQESDLSTPRAGSLRSNMSGSMSSSTASSRLRPPARNSSVHTWHQYRTAPTTPQQSKLTPTSRSPSSTRFAQTRQPYAASQVSSGSSYSYSGSVIRLSERGDGTDLPYVLTLSETRASSF